MGPKRRSLHLIIACRSLLEDRIIINPPPPILAVFCNKNGLSSYFHLYFSSLPNYFAWLLLKKFSPVLPGDYFATYFFGTMSSEIGKTGKERWRACMLDTELNMPFSVGMMFTNAVITPSIENEVHELLVSHRLEQCRQ